MVVENTVTIVLFVISINEEDDRGSRKSVFDDNWDALINYQRPATGIGMATIWALSADLREKWTPVRSLRQYPFRLEIGLTNNTRRISIRTRLIFKMINLGLKMNLWRMASA
ncbi:hypothetical protein L2E82_22825 [Cichorium intybus]|uniref:Uncharacterized protein n=1 Tax=Cichorium intybus TaxID=13427 RepID=A0ACB9DYA5_CICIN|nr:hypothetical protein L2E82_22825 [Cichorium intybus]